MIATRIAVGISLAATILLTTGCGVIYSQQEYGSPRTRQISVGANKADAFANMGAPNSVYKAENGEVFVYKYATGKNVLGIYSKVSRTDTVVVMDTEGVVQFAGPVEMGEGYTIISPPMLDATHPISPDELLFDPENYDYSYEMSHE